MSRTIRTTTTSERPRRPRTSSTTRSKGGSFLSRLGLSAFAVLALSALVNPLALGALAMSPLALIAAATAASPIMPQGSVLVDDAHVAIGSSGCGKSSPYATGRTTTATGKYAGVTWTFRVYVPRSYNGKTPMPLILQHPGWGMSASSEESGAGISGYAEQLGFKRIDIQKWYESRDLTARTELTQ